MANFFSCRRVKGENYERLCPFLLASLCDRVEIVWAQLFVLLDVEVARDDDDASRAVDARSEVLGSCPVPRDEYAVAGSLGGLYPRDDGLPDKLLVDGARVDQAIVNEPAAVRSPVALLALARTRSPA